MFKKIKYVKFEHQRHLLALLCIADREQAPSGKRRIEKEGYLLYNFHIDAITYYSSGGFDKCLNTQSQ